MNAKSSRTESKPKAKSRRTTPKPKGYTALIYFHGMGEQRRYEEVSHLIDKLDEYCHEKKPGRLSNITFGSEQPRGDLQRPVGYVQATYFDKEKKHREQFRFYEGYYANLSAGGMPVWSVLVWLLKLSLMPLLVLITAWRGRMRLHRATLLGLWEEWNKRTPLPKNDREKLLQLYHEFEGLPARRRYRRGTFPNFLKFLHEQNPKQSEQGKRLRGLAIRWALRFLRVQVTIIFLILTLFLYFFLLGRHAIPFLAQEIMKTTMPMFAVWVALSAIFLILLLWGAKIFLSDFMGDVYFWTTYEETAAKNQTRRAILNYCAEFISHVVCDDACERVVLVGHSLGTTVVHDTMLELASRNRAASPQDPAAGPIPLRKIQHIFTMASPVDKIHYLFESTTSTSHRFNRIIEKVRGDLGELPFSDNGRPLIHWINFWNRADVVSSPLYTPASHEYAMQVDNYEMSLHPVPEPVGAHTNYLGSRTVIEIIHDVLFLNRYNFVSLYDEQKGTGTVNFSEAFIGHQGKGHRLNTLIQWLIVLLPWAILLLRWVSE